MTFLRVFQGEIVTEMVTRGDCIEYSRAAAAAAGPEWRQPRRTEGIVNCYRAIACSIIDYLPEVVLKRVLLVLKSVLAVLIATNRWCYCREIINGRSPTHLRPSGAANCITNRNNLLY